MRLYKRHHPDRVPPLEIAPLIDVVFLLIIFFMVTAQFVRITRAEVNLPVEPGEQTQLPEEAGIVINITRDGEIIVAEETVARADFRRFLQREINRRQSREGGEVKMLVRADRDADTTVLNHVLNDLQELGLNVARIATEIPARMGRGGGP